MKEGRTKQVMEFEEENKDNERHVEERWSVHSYWHKKKGRKWNCRGEGKFPLLLKQQEKQESENRGCYVFVIAARKQQQKESEA